MEALKRRRYSSCVATSVLGLALITFAACSQGDSTTGTLAPGGSAGLSGPMVFVNNTGDKTLTSVAVKGDSGNAEINKIEAAEFENAALGDMQFSNGDWVFVNLEFANKVAAIQPLAAATPVHEVNLPTGTRPVHMYRDRNDGEVIWIMNDGDNNQNPTTAGDDLVNCSTRGGGSVTVVHNSHQGVGGKLPEVLRTICVLADGHKVTAFASGTGVPKRAFVSSEVGGEIAVIDDEESSGTYLQMIHRIDLCNASKEGTLPTPTTCNPENATGTTAFTPNNSGPHGIRWSNLTKKVYSIQEGYGQIAEIDPTTLAITKTFELAGTPYTSFGISPDGRFLMLTGETTNPQTIKLGVIDLSATNPAVADLNIAELNGTTTGSFTTGSSSFKFSPDGKRMYLLVGNSALATVTKKDRLFTFDASTLPALTLLREIPLLQTGRHSMDVLAQGAGEAKYVVVSNRGTPGSVSIINATDNSIKDTVTVGPEPGSVLVYYPGAAQAGNQASN